jgi:very-short-patch-repair endonuclease
MENMSNRLSREKAVSDTKRNLARSFRQEATPAEAALWEALRGRKLGGLKFRRQQPVLGFIVDFYCEALNLAVEVDGSAHDSEASQAYDAERDTALKAYGLRILRLRNEDVLPQADSARAKILEYS